MSLSDELVKLGVRGRRALIIEKMASSSKLNRRTSALLWLIAAALLIGIFIYLEQIALLYVVATLGIVLLLLIVAFADLENVGREDFDTKRSG